ncbi:hypothetical protein C1646_778987 [Rhizophagus diaphanus]|nr:hypothetical protein C1646_778987 [Rhizophagus diaphanus] [Rhizophagus sp. MUCL 43196]
MLLRNLNPLQGLYNEIRLIIRNIQNKVIEADIIIESYISRYVFIFCITLTSSESIAFSMIINKLQGQTFSQVGLYLPQSVFSHGQLYVALLRVTLYQCIKVLMSNSSQSC